MTPLQNAYNEYAKHGFILRPAEKNKKFTRETGTLIDANAKPFSKNATGYTAIVPPNIIIIDNDGYKDGGIGFKKLCDDLGYTPKPFARTPSGGEHYAFENIHKDKVCPKAHGYPNLDIFAGYQSVIPIVGTTATNKSDDLGTYTWADDTNTLIVNPWDDKLFTLLNMRDRSKVTNTADYGSILALRIKEDDMPEDEVDELLSQLPLDESFGYHDWLEVGMALYDRYHGSDEGRKKWQEFTEAGENHTKGSTAGIDKWDKGHISPDRITYKRLRLMANEMLNIELRGAITTASLEQLKKMELPLRSYYAERNDNHDEVLVKLIKTYQDREHELGATKVTRKDTLLKQFNEGVPVSKEIQKIAGKLLIGFDGRLYTVCNNHGEIKSNEMTKQGLGEYLMKLGVPKKQIEKVVKDATVNISEVMELSDYLLPQKAVFNIEPHPTNNIADKVLMVYSNPLWDVKKMDFDMEIVNDFMNNVWGGKMMDLLRMMALTIIYKDKKNLIGVIAPPNTAKSKSVQVLGAPKIKMPPLVNAINGGKGIGETIINSMTISGLLLIDEVDKPVPDEMKDFVEGLTLDQFGAGGGTKIVPLYCTVLTSIHDTMFSMADAEIVERAVCIRVDNAKHSIKQSPIYVKDAKKYFEHTTAYIRWVFKQEFLRSYNRDELLELQKRYKIEVKTEDIVEDILEVITKEIVTNTKSKVSGFEFKNNTYWVKDKRQIHDQIETELTHYDIPNTNAKVTEVIDAIFYPNHIAKDRKRLNGTLCWKTKIKPDDGFSDLDVKVAK